MMFSWYGQYLKIGVTQTLKEFLGSKVTKVGCRPLCRLDHLQFHLLISYYQNMFGRENVLILPFEYLKKSQVIFAERIINFSESRGNFTQDYNEVRNMALKAGNFAIRRQINMGISDIDVTQSPIYYNLTQKIADIGNILISDIIHQGTESNMRRYIAETVGDFFRESNQKTSRLTGIKLADIGYDC